MLRMPFARRCSSPKDMGLPQPGGSGCCLPTGTRQDPAPGTGRWPDAVEGLWHGDK